MTTKLKGVVAKAFEDRKFLKALLKNPRNAVKGSGLTLTERELTQLKTLIEKTNKVSLKEVYDLLRYGAKLGIIPTRSKYVPGDPPPPPKWPDQWGRSFLKGKKLGPT